MSPTVAYFVGVATLPAGIAAILLWYAVRWCVHEAWLIHLARRVKRERVEREARELAEDERVCQKLIEEHERARRLRAIQAEVLVEEIEEWFEEGR